MRDEFRNRMANRIMLNTITTPEVLQSELERMLRQAAAMMEGSEADAELAMRLLNQLAIAVEAAHTKRRASDAPSQKPTGGQYCNARR